MNCPSCQQELPADNQEANCPFCGGWLPEKTAYAGPEEKPLPVAIFPAKAFFLLLLGPPILTMLSAWLVHSVNESVSAGIGFFGGIAGGIGCGILLGRRVGRTVETRIGFSVIFALIMMVVCIMLCFFGCMSGGYKIRIG